MVAKLRKTSPTATICSCKMLRAGPDEQGRYGSRLSKSLDRLALAACGDRRGVLDSLFFRVSTIRRVDHGNGAYPRVLAVCMGCAAGSPAARHPARRLQVPPAHGHRFILSRAVDRVVRGYDDSQRIPRAPCRRHDLSRSQEGGISLIGPTAISVVLLLSGYRRNPRP